jgi:hypothetical protein
MAAVFVSVLKACADRSKVHHHACSIVAEARLKGKKKAEGRRLKLFPLWYNNYSTSIFPAFLPFSFYCSSSIVYLPHTKNHYITPELHPICCYGYKFDVKFTPTHPRKHSARTTT